MSIIQHQLAHALLTIIQEATANLDLLTYQSAAEALGRPQNNARAIAQVCDLLDAAAALANVPLLALVAIRDSSGGINPKAWAEVSIRNAIINCSLDHIFTNEDFSAIKKSLVKLEGCGNRKAWAVVKSTIPNEQLLKQLSTPRVTQIQNIDAINDLGTDKAEKETTLTTRYSRDLYIRKKVEVRAKGRCEYCGKCGFKRPDGSLYVEAHHIIALANDGEDRLTNVIALCADHHREAHYGASKEKIEKEMISLIKKIYGL